MSEREIDARVARALGLAVVGEAWCGRYPDDAFWYVRYEQESYPGAEQHPVYLARCVCHLEPDCLEDEPEIYGHRPGCLEVVPHYSTDIRVACLLWDALPYPSCYTSLRSTAIGKWRFDVVDDQHTSRFGVGDTRPMAICLGFLAVMERLRKS